jgi:hypothetical protein
VKKLYPIPDSLQYSSFAYDEDGVGLVAVKATVTYLGMYVVTCTVISNQSLYVLRKSASPCSSLSYRSRVGARWARLSCRVSKPELLMQYMYFSSYTPEDAMPCCALPIFHSSTIGRRDRGAITCCRLSLPTWVHSEVCHQKACLYSMYIKSLSPP